MLSLRRFAAAWIASAILALAVPVRAAEVDKYLPEDTEVVVVINAEQLFDAPAIKKHMVKPLRTFIQQNDAIKDILNDLDFDPFEDLTSITAALTVLGSETKGLIIFHGDFDETLLAEKAEEVAEELGDVFTIHRAGAHPIYEVKPQGGGKPLFIGILDDSTIVAGPEAQYVRDAFAKSRSKKQARVQQALRDLIEHVDEDQSIWFAATANAFAKGDWSGDEHARKSLEKMTGITAGLTVDRDLQIDFAIAAKSAASAKELAQEINLALEQAKKLFPSLAEQHRELSSLQDVVGSVRVTTQGSTVTLQANIREELVENSLKALRK
ncbi:MAG TPA: hypothetical protein VKU02_25880 [Gemmataceae bacterium]|nr:hypothetical protein [Gemmataceae bacterium]